MGQLDDAIREHLELKRRRGADPGLVSREERDALGVVRGAKADGEQGQEAPEGGPSPTHLLESTKGSSGEIHSGGFEGVATTGQETAELDMRTVLDEEEGDEDEEGVRAVRAPTLEPPDSGLFSRGANAGEPADEESLEWEAPAPSRGHSVDETAAGDEEPDEPVEDVLEETPDFLRDTPDQDRLWFEQRPPRDFDFDK
jgi:hypothetical protein